jgi:hypothetical protein
MLRRPVVLALAVLFCASGALPALADGGPGPGTTAQDSGAKIGIKLLEAPVSRRADPRANTYIIDHLPPGAVIRRRVEISNESSVPRHLDVYAAAAAIQDNAFSFAPDRTPDELTTWTSFDETGDDLPPNGTAPVTVTIAVPRDASPGERYGVVWVQAGGSTDPVHNVALVNRVGVRMYLDIGPGGEPPSDFQVDKLVPARSRDGRPEVLAQVRNTGGRAVDITGTLTLSDGPGGLRAGPYSAQPGTTLAPGGRALVTVLLDRRLPEGPWSAHLQLKSGLIERDVTATITFPASPGAASASLTSGLSHWSPRLGLVALAVFALAGPGVYLRSRLARRRRR